MLKTQVKKHVSRHTYTHTRIYLVVFALSKEIANQKYIYVLTVNVEIIVRIKFSLKIVAVAVFGLIICKMP